MNENKNGKGSVPAIAVFEASFVENDGKKSLEVVKDAETGHWNEQANLRPTKHPKKAAGPIQQQMFGSGRINGEELKLTTEDAQIIIGTNADGQKRIVGVLQYGEHKNPEEHGGQPIFPKVRLFKSLELLISKAIFPKPKSSRQEAA